MIDPALKEAGWGVVEASRVAREVITLGLLQGAGKRVKQDIADYVSFFKRQKLGVIEAKKKSLLGAVDKGKWIMCKEVLFSAFNCPFSINLDEVGA